jgi:hypothetical protein
VVGDLETLTKKQFLTIPQAVMALAKMERELISTKSYVEIRKLERAAEALKLLIHHVAEVKNKAELVVLAANQRIGEEIKLIPKASGGSKATRALHLDTPKRGDVVPHRTASSRLGKLAAI